MINKVLILLGVLAVVVAGIYASALSFRSFPLESGGILALIIAYVFGCFIQIPPDKRALVLTFQKPSRTLEPGLGFVFKFFQELVLFDTKTVDLEFGSMEVTSQNLTAKVEGVSLRIRWDNLRLAIRELGSEDPQSQLHNLMQEITLQAFRQELAARDWRQVMGATGVSDAILARIRTSTSITITSATRTGSIEVLEVHWESLKLPEEFQKSVRAREAAVLEGEAQRTRRQAEGQARLLEIKEMLGLNSEEPIPSKLQEQAQQMMLLLRQLERDEKMASGESEMILFPSTWGSIDPEVIQRLMAGRAAGGKKGGKKS